MLLKLQYARCNNKDPLTQHLRQLGRRTDMQNHSYFLYDTAYSFELSPLPSRLCQKTHNVCEEGSDAAKTW